MRDGLGRVQNLLVIGGSSEIGAAAAEAVTARGARTVILAGRAKTRLDAVAAPLRAGGACVHLLDYRADMPAAEVADVFERAAQLAGDLDVVLVCVGVRGDADDLGPDASATEDGLRANFLGPALAVRVAAARLAAQGHGVVVVLSSVAALRPRADLPAYAAAKAGLDSYARSLAVRLRGRGVRLVVVRPGQVRTRMSAGLPEPPLTVDAAVVGRAVARCLDTTATLVYVPGLWRPVAGVLRALPGPVFRRLAATARRGPVPADGATPGPS